MKENKKGSVDIFGLAPYGESIKLSVEKGFNGTPKEYLNLEYEESEEKN